MYSNRNGIPVKKIPGSHLDILMTSFPIFVTGHFKAKIRTFLCEPFCLEIISFSSLRGEQLNWK